MIQPCTASSGQIFVIHFNFHENHDGMKAWDKGTAEIEVAVGQRPFSSFSDQIAEIT